MDYLDVKHILCRVFNKSTKLVFFLFYLGVGRYVAFVSMKNHIVTIPQPVSCGCAIQLAGVGGASEHGWAGLQWHQPAEEKAAMAYGGHPNHPADTGRLAYIHPGEEEKVECTLWKFPWIHRLNARIKLKLMTKFMWHMHTHKHFSYPGVIWVESHLTAARFRARDSSHPCVHSSFPTMWSSQ